MTKTKDERKKQNTAWHQAARAGSAKAKAELMTGNDGLIKYIANRVLRVFKIEEGREELYDDLFAEGSLALVKAVNDVTNPANEDRWDDVTSYLGKCIEHAIHRWLVKHLDWQTHARLDTADGEDAADESNAADKADAVAFQEWASARKQREPDIDDLLAACQTDHERQWVELKRKGRVSDKDAAPQLGLTPSTVRTLRERLETRAKQRVQETELAIAV